MFVLHFRSELVASGQVVRLFGDSLELFGKSILKDYFVVAPPRCRPLCDPCRSFVETQMHLPSEFGTNCPSAPYPARPR